MKIQQNDLVLNRPGKIKVTPEIPDDLWFASNLIRPGDSMTAETTRRVILPGSKANSSRVRLTLEIRITAVDYEKDSSVIRVRGKNIAANEYLATGAFHTVEIEMNMSFSLKKKSWDAAAIDSLRDISAKSSTAELGVVMINRESARLFLVGSRETTLCSRIQNQSRSKPGDFLESVSAAFKKHIDFETVRCVVIAGPDSARDELRQFLLSAKSKSITKNKSRIVTVKAKGEAAVNDILHDRAVVNLIKDAGSAMEVMAFKEFKDAVSGKSEQACYGISSVEVAAEMEAVEALLVTEELVRSKKVEERRRYGELVKTVKGASGKVFVYSCGQVFGEQLKQFTGVAAILRFPMPDLDDLVL